MSIHNNPRIVTDGLIVYLDAENEKSYPKYGTDKWGDLSGRGNHFSMVGTLTYSNGYFEFPGTATSYFVSSGIQHPELEITTELWVLPNIDSSGDSLYGFVPNNSAGSHAIIDQTSLLLSGPTSSANSNVGIVDNAWKHVVRTSSRSVRTDMSAGTERLYIDGKLEYSTILDPEVRFGTFGFIILGQKSNVNTFIDPLYSYAGRVAVFKLYSKVLSSEEVSINYKALRSRFLSKTS